MKNYIKTLASGIIVLSAVLNLHAEEFDSTYSVTPCQNYDLITKMLIGPGVVWHPSGRKIEPTSKDQIGVFSNLVAKVIPTFTNGVILSTGEIADGMSLVNESNYAEWTGDRVHKDQKDTDRDPDLDALFGSKLYDPAGIILYIQPKNTTINIPFLMASEEFYLDSDNSEYPAQEDYEDYSDKFAFFLQELGPASSGVVDNDLVAMTNNIALLPDKRGQVEIATVNQHTNVAYFISNVTTNEDGELDFPATDINLPMEFNGAIVGPVAVAEDLNPEMIYKLKIIIGDENDATVNSAVFLSDCGITSGADLKIDVSGPTSMTEPGAVTYTNTVSNVGPAPAKGVVVTNYLPVGANYIACEQSVGEVVGPVLIGGTNCLVWTIGERFLPGSNAVMTVDCTLPKKDVYTNLSFVVTSTGDYDESNNTGKCVTVVGDIRPKLVIQAVTREKRYGDELNISDLQFVASVTNEYGQSYAIHEIATGIDVTFTNKATAAEAFPTNDVTGVGEYYICIANVKLNNPGDFSEVIYERGLLMVTQRCVTVTTPSMEIEPEAELPTSAELFLALTNNWDTLVVGTIPSETAADAGVIRIDSLTLERSEKVSQAITASGVADQGNYKVTYLPGQLTVKPKIPLDVYIGATNVVYLAPVPVFTWDNIVTNVTVTDPGKNWKDYVTGWDQPGLIVTSYTASESDGVGGNYWISTNRTGTVKLLSERYDITVHDGTLTVEPRQIEPKDPGEEPPDEPNPLLPWAAAYPVEKCYDDLGTNIVYASGNIVGDVEYEFAYAVDKPTMDSPLWVDYDNIFTNVMFDADGTVRSTNVWCRVTAGGNYIGTVVGATVTVTQRCVTVTAPSMELEPEAELPTSAELFQALTNNWDTLVVGMIPSEAAADAGVVRIASLTLENSGEKVSQAIRAEGEESQGNYKVTYLPGQLTVKPKIPLDVYIGATNVVYLAPVPVFTWDNIVTNVVAENEEEIRWNEVPKSSFGFMTTYMPTSDVGTYEITTNGNALASGRYAITVHPGELTVEPRPIAPKNPGEEPPDEPNPLFPWAAAYPVEKCYDGLGTNIVYASGNIVGDVEYEFAYAATKPALDDVVGWTDYANIFTNVMFDADGTVRSTNVWCRVTAGGNYIGTVVGATVTITQRCVTVTATSTGKAWSGDPLTDPELEYTTAPDPWYAVEADESLFVGELEREAGEDPGEYAITQKVSFAAGGNYRFDFVPGTFTINALIRLDVYIGATNVVYGDSVPVLTWDNIVTNVVAENEEEIQWDEVPVASFGFTTAYTPTSDVGTYAITTNGNALVSGRYVITVHSGDLTVEKRPLKITISNRGKVYGDEYPFGGPKEFKVADGCLVNGDKIKSVKVTSEGAAAGAHYREGGYDITASPADVVGEVGTRLENYDIQIHPGKMVVDPYPITITANNATNCYGEVSSFDGTEFTVDPAMLPNEDRIATVTLTNTTLVTADVDTYLGAIVPSHIVTGVNTNDYDFTFVKGTLTITQAVLRVSVNDATWTVGTDRPDYSCTMSPLVPGDTIADVAGEDGVQYTNAVWMADMEPIDDDAGTYSNEIWSVRSSMNGPKAGNYLIEIVPGNLTVLAAPPPPPPDDPKPVLKTEVSASLNWNTGLLDLTLTVRNVGEGSVDPTSDYWVELAAGPAATEAGVTVDRSYCLNEPTGTLTNGADYVNLTATVKGALRSAGGDEIFGPGEEITVRGVSVYHWKRWSPELFITGDTFFVAGQLAGQMVAAENATDAELSMKMVAAMTLPRSNEGTSSSLRLASDQLMQVTLTAASVYDGVLYRNGTLAGTVQVKLAKSSRKTGLSSLTAILTPLDEKKITVKGTFDSNASTFAGTAKDGRVLTLTIGMNGLVGSFGDLVIDGARNRYSSKADEDKLVVAAANGWIGSYSLASPSADGWDTYTVTLAKKGKVKVAGTLADGTKVSVSSQMILNETSGCIPVIFAKKSVSRAFVIWFRPEGVDVIGIADAVFGRAGSRPRSNALTFDREAFAALVGSGAVEVFDLKITYMAKKGTFNGTFKAKAGADGPRKAISVPIAGVVVDGVGYGTATVKRKGTVAIRID